MDQPIIDFFQPRKEAWLKKNIKATFEEHEIRVLEQECDYVFSLEQWLPNAAKRAGQISISTHPCTFTHPSARKNKNGQTTAVIESSKQSNDGFLRSGNISVEADALGNAAALDVHKFLTLEMSDGQRLLDHIEQDTEVATRLLNIKNASYVDLKKGFLAMVEKNEGSVSSAKVKQVYFPVESGYHQLSLLTASGITFELRKRIDKLRFSEESKQARALEKNNAHHDIGYKSVLNITTIGYGGTKPQNISVLNNQNGGRAYLLLSVPPKLRNRDILFPSSDFFSQSVNSFHYKDIFFALHTLFMKYENSWELRLERDEYYREVVDRIVQKMWQVRLVASEQFNANRSQLNKVQKIWLLVENEKIRESEDYWLQDLTENIARFIFNGYEKVLKKKALVFSDAELAHIHRLVVNEQESLR